MENNNNEVYGEGFFGDVWKEVKRRINGVKMAIKGVRTNLKPSVRKILEHEDGVIQEMNVCRQPINSKIKKLLYWVNTIGSHRMSHDELFHLFLIVRLDNGKVFVMEKNEDINIKPFKPDELDECQPVELNQKISMAEVLLVTREKVGDRRFYLYDAFNENGGGNCQTFVMDMLTSIGIDVSPELKSFILQKVDKLIPEWSKRITSFITSLYNRGKTFVFGEGGAVWGLSPEEQEQYKYDTQHGLNLVTDGSAVFWDPSGKMGLPKYIK